MELTHTQRELRLVFRRVTFSSESETFSEGEQLIETTGTLEDERFRVQYNVVRHAIVRSQNRRQDSGKTDSERGTVLDRIQSGRSYYPRFRDGCCGEQ
jgi:hypothetical protein